MFRLLLLVVAAALFCGPALADKRVALVVSVDEYEAIRPLNNAVNDGRAMELTLSELGFDVTLVANRSLSRIRRAMEDFREDAADADVALVFFSGHGAEIAGDNRLLPADADLTSLDRLIETSLPLEEVRDLVAEVSKVGLILLDACRDDPFGMAGGEGRGARVLADDVAAAVTPGLKRAPGRSGKAGAVLFAFSASPGAVAADGLGENSPFTAALTKFLPQEGLEIRSVLTLVQQEVYDLSRGAQLPYVESGLPGLFFATGQPGERTERERLLLAMAEMTASMREEVERVAAAHDMPLAPLYAALIARSSGGADTGDVGSLLAEAADAYVKVAAEMRALSSSDPEVARLREEARQLLARGSVETSRLRLAAAAAVDNASRQALRANYDERTLSEAGTYAASGGAAATALDYRNAVLDYERALALHDELGTESAGTDEALGGRIAILETLGKIRRRMGDGRGAETAFSAMIEAGGRAMASGSTDLLVRYGAAIGHEQLGTLLSERGDAGGALQAFDAALEIARKLAAEDSRVRGFSAMVASLQSRIGHVKRARGDREGAFDAYAAALGAARGLASRFPDDTDLQSDMVDYQRSLAGLMSEQGNLLGALAALGEAAETVETVRRRLPDDATWQLHALGLHQFRARLLTGHGGHEQARDERIAALALAEELSARSPMDLNLRRTLADALREVADADQAAGATADAGKGYARARSIMWHLVSTDPRNLDWQEALSVLHDRIADALRAGGDLKQAAQAFEAARAIRQRLVDANPSNRWWRENLSVSHGRLGEVLMRQGDLSGAGDHFERQVALSRQLVEAAPNDVNHLSALVSALGNLGNLHAARGAAAQAREAYSGAVEAARRALALNPASLDVKSFLHTAYIELGDIDEDEGRLEAALESYRSALSLAEELVAAKGHTLRDRLDLAEAHRRVGDAYYGLGDLEGVKKAYVEDYGITLALRQSYPDNRDVKLAFAISLSRNGKLFNDAARPTDARGFLEQSARILTELARSDPTDLDMRFRAVVVFSMLAQARHKEGDAQAAAAGLRAVLAVLDQMVAAGGARLEWRWQRFNTCWLLGEMGSDPVASYGEAVRIGERLVAEGLANGDQRQWLADARAKLAGARDGGAEAVTGGAAQ